MEKILLKNIKFDYQEEEKQFNNVFTFLDNALGEGAFVKYRLNKPIGGLAPAYYEAITVGSLNVLQQIVDVPIDKVRHKIIATVQTDEFRQNTGSGANKRDKLEGRIQVIQDALLELINE